MRELKDRHIATYGFLGYPVLQAADIALYQAHVVPVGEDQLPHLELTREIVRRFNGLYKSIFPEPKPLLTPVAKLLGLDGRKMSKSYGNVVALSDPPETIKKKVQTMFTDPKRIRRTDPGHPQTCNLHSYYVVFFPDEEKEVAEACRKADMGCTDCKKRLGEALCGMLAPVQERRRALFADKGRLEAIAEAGRQKARARAHATLEAVRDSLSFVPCPIK